MRLDSLHPGATVEAVRDDDRLGRGGRRRPRRDARADGRGAARSSARSSTRAASTRSRASRRSGARQRRLSTGHGTRRADRGRGGARVRESVTRSSANGHGNVGRLARPGIVLHRRTLRAGSTGQVCVRAGIDVVWRATATPIERCRRSPVHTGADQVAPASCVITRPFAGPEDGPDLLGRRRPSGCSRSRSGWKSACPRASRSPDGPSRGSARRWPSPRPRRCPGRPPVANDIVLPRAHRRPRTAADVPVPRPRRRPRPIDRGIAALRPSRSVARGRGRRRGAAAPVFDLVGAPGRSGLGTLATCQARVTALARAGITDLRSSSPRRARPGRHRPACGHHRRHDRCPRAARRCLTAPNHPVLPARVTMTTGR